MLALFELVFPIFQGCKIPIEDQKTSKASYRLGKIITAKNPATRYFCVKIIGGVLLFSSHLKSSFCHFFLL